MPPSRRSANRKIALFLSDGVGTLTTATVSPLALAAAAGIIIDTFSIGTGSTGCGPGAGLRSIADLTGGRCTEVSDPTLPTGIFSSLKPPGIDHVDVSLNGGVPALASLDVLGHFSIDMPGPFHAGLNPIEAVVFATDATTAGADVAVRASAPTTVAPGPSPAPGPAPSPPSPAPGNPSGPPFPPSDFQFVSAPRGNTRLVSLRPAAAPPSPSGERGQGLAQTGSDLRGIAGAALLLMLGGAALRASVARRPGSPS